MTNPFLRVLIKLHLKKAVNIKFTFNSDASAGFLSWIKGKLDRWRLALVGFLVVYAFFLLLDLGYMSIQWDEIPHLYGGLLLLRGQTQPYMTLYGYYPPLYDIVTTGFFGLLGPNAATGRLTAVTFSLLSIWITFELAKRTYGPRNALVSAILLGTMPGFFWLSRITMLETMLIFFFSLALFFFFTWINTQRDKALLFTCLAMGLGFLAKYQIVVAGIVMIACIPLLARDKLRAKFSKFLLVPLIAVAVVVPWLLILYQTNGVNNFGQLLYAIREGGEDRAVYSNRFFLPVFYLIEMTWPFNDIPVHPISLPVYVLGLLGLGVMAWRHKTEDKFFLAWFAVVYIFFTVIPNRQWRYVTPLFPVLAISAAGFVLFAYGRIAEAWKRTSVSISRKRLLQIAAGVLIALAVSSIVYSSVEAYQMTARDQIHIPIEEAVDYAANRLSQNQSLMVVAAFNLFNQDMVKFYLEANGSRNNEVLQYPVLPVDAFKPDFNFTEIVSECQEKNVKYVFLYEYGGGVPYFESNWTAMWVYGNLTATGRFTDVYRVGSFPRTITIFSFA